MLVNLASLWTGIANSPWTFSSAVSPVLQRDAHSMQAQYGNSVCLSVRLSVTLTMRTVKIVLERKLSLANVTLRCDLG